MKWMRFTLAGKTSYGIVEGDQVAVVTGTPFDGYERTGTKHPLSEVKFEIPLEPKTFYAVGFNYPDHVIEMAKQRGGFGADSFVESISGSILIWRLRAEWGGADAERRSLDAPQR